MEENTTHNSLESQDSGESSSIHKHHGSSDESSSHNSSEHHSSHSSSEHHSSHSSSGHHSSHSSSEHHSSHSSSGHHSSHSSSSSKNSRISTTWRTLRRKFRRNKRAIGKVTAVIAVVIAGLLLFEFFSNCGSYHEKTSTTTDGRAKIQVNGQWYELRDDIETVLGIGIDKYADEAEVSDVNLQNQQCDFLVLLIVDTTNETYELLHINRDTMTDVQEISLNNEVIGTVYEQICLAHTYGTGGKDSCRNTVDAASHLLDETPISHYVAFTMDVVPIVNDAVGGVTVHIDDDFSNTDPTLVQGSDVTLQGEQALTFVRARSSMVDDSTNLNRMQRQRTYITALRSAAEQKMQEDEKWAATTLLDIAEYLTTDLTQTDLSNFADVLINYKQSDILTIQGETQIINQYGEDHIAFYADEEALTQQVLDLFYTQVEE